jgi:hypothetical protein
MRRPFSTDLIEAVFLFIGFMMIGFLIGLAL